MAKFDQGDDSVVVIIGSGAGGGTLANELCSKGHQGSGSGSRRDAIDRQLHQRRMELVRTARLAGQAHHVRLVAGREGLLGPAGMDLQNCGRHHDTLGRRVAALARARIPRAHRLRRHQGRVASRLAAHAEGSRAVLLEGRRQAGRDAHPRHTRPAGQQQLQGDVRRGDEARLQGGAHRQHGDQQPAARGPRLLPADRLLLPGLQERGQVVDALHRDAQGREDRQAGTAPRVPRVAQSSTTTTAR